MEKTKTPSMIKILWFIYRRYYREKKFAFQVWAYLLFLFFDRVYPLLISWMLAQLIDKSINAISNQLAISALMPTILVFGVVIIGGVIISSLRQYFDSLMTMWIGYLEDEVYVGKFLTVEPQAYENPDFIKDKTTLNWNGSAVWGTLETAFETVTMIPVIAVSLVAILKFSPLLALCAVVASIPYAFVVRKFGARVWGIWRDRGEEKIKYQAYKNAGWTSNFEIFQEMYIFKYGRMLLDKALEINKKFNIKLEANNRQRYIWSTVSSVISSVVYLLAIILTIRLVLNGQLTVGMLTFAISAYQKFNGDISDIFYNISWISGNKEILEKFYNVQNWKNTIVNGSTPLPSDKRGIALEFRDVSFKYPNTKKWVLKDLSFKINEDEDLAVVGRNGVGKTTLIKLMLRVYDPNKGDIFVDGINIKDINLDEYYRNIGILSQTFNHLGITAEDNIYVGDVEREKSLEAIQTAAKEADIHNDIVALPEGYQTFLTRDLKKGIQLSGGQWQKLAIARAFFRSSKLLILDEPTSAVDALSEEKIFDSIRANAKNKTTLIVSHRFATVRKAKRIIVIDKGRIVEDGNHEDLMKQKGLYAEMYNTQAGEKEESDDK